MFMYWVFSQEGGSYSIIGGRISFEKSRNLTGAGRKADPNQKVSEKGSFGYQFTAWHSGV